MLMQLSSTTWMLLQKRTLCNSMVCVFVNYHTVSITLKYFNIFCATVIGNSHVHDHERCEICFLELPDCSQHNNI